MDFASRTAEPADVDSICELYSRAFAEEELASLMNSLLPAPAKVVNSMIATIDSQLVGHIAFTYCGEGLALLGPLAVDPNSQSQ